MQLSCRAAVPCYRRGTQRHVPCRTRHTSLSCRCEYAADSRQAAQSHPTQEDVEYKQRFAADNNILPFKSDRSTLGSERGSSESELSYHPFISRLLESASSSELPIMLYIPDVPGMGYTAGGWEHRLCSSFNVFEVSIPPDNRSSVTKLAHQLKASLDEMCKNTLPERPVYLMGDGFGALLAIHLAAECRLLSRLVLVNPAICYEDSPLARVAPILSSMPSPMLQAAPLMLLPIFNDPIRLAHTIPTAAVLRFPDAGGMVQGIQDALPQLQQLATTLPPDTLKWRLQQLQEHSSSSMEKLSKVQSRTMVLVGGRDLLMPCTEHVNDIRFKLQRGFVKVLPEGGHGLLANPSFDLVQLMKQEGFYTTRLRYTTPVTSLDEINRYGTPGPVEMPTQKEARRVGQMWTRMIRQLCSPVYFSRRQDGSVMPGFKALEGLPRDRPIIIVGNHQTYALDMYALVEDVAAEADMLLRGLAHPGAFIPAKEDGKNALPEVLTNTFKTFGAVPVSPQNFYRLLQRNEAILLYPGGVREGFKRKHEAYRLFWPHKSEFVRMAALFNATILPMSSVGIDDSLEILLDSDEIAVNPWLGPAALEAAAAMPAPRTGVSEASELDERWIPPIFVPKLAPSRLYFLFHEPVELRKEMAKDKAACEELYQGFRGKVQGGMEWLLERRENDPYKDFVKRMMYENAPLLGPRQAPTFKL